MRAQGYKPGPVTDDKKKEHSSLRPYDELPEDEKEQNRDNARDIQNKLASAGYKIIPLRGAGKPSEFTRDEAEACCMKMEKARHYIIYPVDNNNHYRKEKT